MNFTPTSAQTLFMLRLVFGPREPKLSEALPRLDKAALREELKSLGLIDYEQRGRSKHILLTELGWAWVQDHLDASFNPIGTTPGHVLREVLPRLKAFLAAQQFTLGELFMAAEMLPPGDAAAERPVSASAEEELLNVLRILDAGRHTRLQLADARAALPTLTAADFDTAALGLQAKGRIVLYQLDEPSQRSAEIERAAIHVGGNSYHIAYLAR